jgi:hypothetical protein
MKVLLFVAFIGLILSIQAKAVGICKGGVTIECIKFVYADAGYNGGKAAKACSRP